MVCPPPAPSLKGAALNCEIIIALSNGYSPMRLFLFFLSFSSLPAAAAAESTDWLRSIFSSFNATTRYIHSHIYARLPLMLLLL